MKNHCRLHLQEVGVYYFRNRRKSTSVRELLQTSARSFGDRILGRGKRDRDDVFWALRHVSFSANDGDTIAVIGRNGAGKSTLMRAIAGIMRPDEGEVTRNGRVSSLLTLNTGQQMNLTGRENIYLTGMLLGMNRRQIDSKMDKIIEFSELGDFIDEPVKNYSSGMRSRLGFSTIVHADADILLLDEIFSVGDATFRNKATAEMETLMQKAKTIFIVTHSIGFARRICNKALWLEHGEVKAQGDVTSVTDAYEVFTGSGPTSEGKTNASLWTPQQQSS